MNNQNAKLLLGIVLGVGAIYLLSAGGVVGNGILGVGSGNGNGNNNKKKLSGGGGAEIGNGFVEGGGSTAHGIIGSGLGTILGIGAAVGAAYLLTSSELAGHAEGNG